jgi:hypothetical protein
MIQINYQVIATQFYFQLIDVNILLDFQSPENTKIKYLGKIHGEFLRNHQTVCYTDCTMSEWHLF